MVHKLTPAQVKMVTYSLLANALHLDILERLDFTQRGLLSDRAFDHLTEIDKGLADLLRTHREAI